MNGATLTSFQLVYDYTQLIIILHVTLRLYSTGTPVNKKMNYLALASASCILACIFPAFSDRFFILSSNLFTSFSISSNLFFTFDVASR